MTNLVRFEQRENVGIITLDNPPVNALAAELRITLLSALGEAMNNPAVSAVVITGDGSCFSAGADIREFGQAPHPDAPTLRQVIEKIEDCPKPIIAAIAGVAVGGGFELTLGCHYRIATKSARLGLPEVQLGLIPGAGGTQRLPRLIGAEPALRIVLSGDHLDSEQALALGILDEIAGSDLTVCAIVFSQKIIGKDLRLRRLRDREPDPPDQAVFERSRKNIQRWARGLIAPHLCIDSVENALKLSFNEGMRVERSLFERCRDSEQSRAQRHVFFAERRARKVSVEPYTNVDKAAVIGAGTMGTGIAMNFANAGIPVSIVEVSQAALDNGLEAIRKNYASSVSKGRISQDTVDARMHVITGTLECHDIADADIVIEAVFEEMELKKQVFKTLDRVCKREAILATNTSTLDVNEIAAATSRPGNVVGMHFFSPANVMKLLENVRGNHTSEETIATVMQLSKRLNKVGVLVGVCDGFVGNRMLYAYTRQASFLLEEGASPQQVDKVIYDFGFPMGPFAVGDLAGLDVGWRIRQRRATTRPKDERYSPIADRICEMGRFGQKTGAGWYRYEAGSRTPIPDPAIDKLIRAVSVELRIKRRAIENSEILERCLYPLINEGAKVLDEGIATRPGDIDVVWVNGYGFPIYRGGPMYYADQIGPKRIYETMSSLYDIHGELLKPAPLLARLAKSGERFQDVLDRHCDVDH